MIKLISQLLPNCNKRITAGLMMYLQKRFTGFMAKNQLSYSKQILCDTNNQCFIDPID